MAFGHPWSLPGDRGDALTQQSLQYPTDLFFAHPGPEAPSDFAFLPDSVSNEGVR